MQLTVQDLEVDVRFTPYFRTYPGSSLHVVLEREILIVFIIVDYVKEQEMQFVRQPFPESDSRKVSWRRTRKPSTNYNFVLSKGPLPIYGCQA